MRLVRTAAILALAGGLAGCALLTPPPVIQKRYAKLTTAQDANPAVLVAVSSSPTKGDASSVAITALSDRAQAALVTENKGSPPTELKDDDADSGPAATLDQTKVTRTLVVGVRPVAFFEPGDRIEAVRIAISVDPKQQSQWKITSWTQAATTKTVIDIGKLTEASTRKLTAETGLKLDHALPDTKLGFEADRTTTQEFEVKDVTSLTAAVDANGVAWLDEVAGWRDDLATNLTMNVVLSALPLASGDTVFVKVVGLTKDDPGPPKKKVLAAAGDLRLTTTDVLGPANPLEPVCGTAKLSYLRRHIAAGAATFTEADDEIVVASGETSARFVLAPPPLLATYGLKLGDRIVHYKIGSRRAAALNLRALKDAIELRDWLAARKPSGALGTAPETFSLGLVSDDFTFTPIAAADFDKLYAGRLDLGRLRTSQENLLTYCSR